MRRSARVPGSLRCPPTGGAAPQERPRRWQHRADVSPTKVVTTACLLAASPPTMAIAQSAASANSLPPLDVEAKAAKTTSAQSNAVSSAAPAAATKPIPEQKAASPYVDPVAPYKVQESGSSKITEPLADTPKTVTAISNRPATANNLTAPVNRVLSLPRRLCHIDQPGWPGIGCDTSRRWGFVRLALTTRAGAAHGNRGR
jgi:catecholate siderophore receptor